MPPELNAGRAHPGSRQPAHPGHDGRVGCRTHELGADVGIQHDRPCASRRGHAHSGKVAARGPSVRGSRSRSIPPRSPKRPRSAWASPVDSVATPTASVRMARISASVERPCWAARIRSRSRTSSSRSLMLSAASPAIKLSATSCCGRSARQHCSHTCLDQRGLPARQTAASRPSRDAHRPGPPVQIRQLQRGRFPVSPPLRCSTPGGGGPPGAPHRSDGFGQATAT